jgi:histidinol phosphatase-like enzyme
MCKAVFLDRDGVVNREIGDYIKRPEDFEGAAARS